MIRIYHKDTKNTKFFNQNTKWFSMDIEQIGKQIVDSALQVHKALGPGLLESAYQVCLKHELEKRGLRVDCEVQLPIVYDGQKIDAGYRIDVLVEDLIINENKVVEEITAIHKAQLLTYMKLKQCWLGYLLNWNNSLMKDGIKRMVNGEKPSN